MFNLADCCRQLLGLQDAGFYNVSTVTRAEGAEGGYCFTCMPAPDNPCAYMNSSCQPNCGAELDDSPPTSIAPQCAGLRRRVLIRTLRAVAPGEELCWDYRAVCDTRDDELPCLCGSQQCRGKFLEYVEPVRAFSYYLRMALLACDRPELTDHDLRSLDLLGMRGALLSFVGGARLPGWLLKWCALLSGGQATEDARALVTAMQALRFFLAAQADRMTPPFERLERCPDNSYRFTLTTYSAVKVHDVPLDIARYDARLLQPPKRKQRFGTLRLDGLHVLATMCKYTCGSPADCLTAFQEEIRGLHIDGSHYVLPSLVVKMKAKS
jgi:hypothetical protein